MTFHFAMPFLSKYRRIIITEWQRQLSFKITVLSYRIGNTLEFLIQVVIWMAVFSGHEIVNGYTYSEMISYVLVGWMISFLTSKYGLHNIIAREIHDGSMSSFLMKPMDYLVYKTTVSLGRVSLAALSGGVIQLIFLLAFASQLVLSRDPYLLFIGFLMVALSYFLELLMSILIGLLGFWVLEVDGLYFTIDVLRKALSGAYFPISFLPLVFLKVFNLFPFVYSFFFPTQIFLGKIGVAEALKGLAIEAVWLLLLVVIIRFLWSRGLKRYEAVGI